MADFLRGGRTMTQSAKDILTQTRQWVNWKPEIRNGKETKIPINPRTGDNASTTDPETWGVYDEALNYDSSHIGFVFAEGDGLTGTCECPGKNG